MPSPWQNGRSTSPAFRWPARDAPGLGVPSDGVRDGACGYARGGDGDRDEATVPVTETATTAPVTVAATAAVEMQGDAGVAGESLSPIARPGSLAQNDHAPTAAPLLDPATVRKALAEFATGVTIITSLGHNDELVGMTANSFNAVSLQPPLVLFSMMRDAYSRRAFLSARYFAVNILSDKQRALSERFAQALQDKWSGVGYCTWDSGCPILDGCLANLECEYESTHDGGDHVIFVGRILRMQTQSGLQPLLFFRGEYAELSE